MHSNRVHTIFWQPAPLPGGVSSFSTSPVSYQQEVNTYFEDVAADNGLSSNVYSVGTQYYDGAPGSASHISYSVAFPGTDTETNATGFPASTCTDQLEAGGAALPVCLDAPQLAHEIEAAMLAKNWSAGMSSIFFIYTPKGVGSCFNAGESSESSTSSCAYSGSHGYCAYHSNFKDAKGEEVIFAYMPYGATPSCDDGARPGGSDAGPVIDSGSHEQNEAITDPTGAGWWDSLGTEATNADYGFEIGDLCVQPEWEAMFGPLSPQSSAFETPTAFNQIINTHRYLLQREWSNAAGPEGACVQRLVPAAFSPPAGAQATQPVSFDGSNSGTVADPVTSWTWDFGDGSSSIGESPTSTHTYASSGEYPVTLTVTDAFGNSNTTVGQVTVGAPPSTVTTTATVTTSLPPPPPPAVTVTTQIPPSPASHALTASQLAGILGLPSDRVAVRGLGTIPLGHAECPPACSIVLKLYATVRTTKHHRRTVKRVSIGTLATTVAAKGTGALVLTLNATGRKLLAKSHKLASQLIVTVVGQEGGSWQIARTLTLTSSGSAARHGRSRG